MPTSIKLQGGPLEGKLEILNSHIGIYAIDLWDDTDGSGGLNSADKFVRRLKEYNGPDEPTALLGHPAELNNRSVQFIWGVRRNQDNLPSKVRIHLSQGGTELSGFPKVVEIPFRDGSHHEFFSVFYFLTAGS